MQHNVKIEKVIADHMKCGDIFSIIHKVSVSVILQQSVAKFVQSPCTECLHWKTTLEGQVFCGVPPGTFSWDKTSFLTEELASKVH